MRKGVWLSLPAIVELLMITAREKWSLPLKQPMASVLSFILLMNLKKFSARLKPCPVSMPQAKKLKGLFIGHANDVELDGSGRILVPPTLRSYVGLEKKVVLVGQGKKFELWDEEAWNAKRESWLGQEESEEEMPEEVKGLSL